MIDNMAHPRFTPRVCAYDPAVDLQEVDQFGFVNLSEAFEKGIIPSVVDASPESFNGVQAPGTLISRSQDVFESLRKAEYVRRSLENLNAREKEKAESQVEKSLEAAGDVTS